MESDSGDSPEARQRKCGNRLWKMLLEGLQKLMGEHRKIERFHLEAGFD
jgi:hypothetical protein